MDFVRVTPISRLLRLEIDLWKAKHLEWSLIWGNTGIPGFQSFARSELEFQDATTQQIDRWLGGSLLHGWRGHWATLMDRLTYGWDAATGDGGRKSELQNHVAFLGDWATSGGTQAEVYARLNPGILQAIAEFEHAADVVKRFSQEMLLELEEVFTSIYGATEEEVDIRILQSLAR